MRCRPWWMKPCLVVCLSLLCVESWAASEIETKSLKGLVNFSVLIEDLEDASPPRLSREALQTDVELELRRLGLPVVDEESTGNYLCVIANSLEIKSLSGISGYAVRIEVFFNQPVYIGGGEDLKIHVLLGTLFDTRSKMGEAFESEMYRRLKPDIDQLSYTRARTWRVVGSAYLPPDRAAKVTREYVVELVRMFANDFLKANPKKSEKEGENRE